MIIESNANVHVGLTYPPRRNRNWRSLCKAGSTAEAFPACIQTMSDLPELATFLIEKHGFRYLFSGELLYDPIEARSCIIDLSY